MKRIFLIIAMLFSVAYGQTIGQLRYDTVVVMKQGGNGELKVMNSTRSVLGGVLTNMGNGWGQWVVPTAVATNIYNSDGTLTGVRTLTNPGFTLTFDGGLLSQLNTSLGVTQDDTKGLRLLNSTSAAAGAQQISPSIHWSGRGWKTNATAASRSVDFRAYVLPVEGAIAPTGKWLLESSINAGAYDIQFGVGNNGQIYLADGGSGDAGTSGYLLSSGGSGSNATWVNPSTITIPISSLTAATGTNSIDNGNFLQTWNWDALSGPAIRMFSNSTAAAGGVQSILSLSMSGANSNTGQITRVIDLSNSHTGTTSTNVGIRAFAVNGATNIAADFSRGEVRIGEVGSESGILKFNGSTSGTATITVSAAAGTPTLTLPTVTGTIAAYTESSTASSATPTPTGNAKDNYFDVTALAANATFAAPSGTPANHNILLVRIKDNGTPRTIAWNAIYRASTDFALPTTTVTSLTIYVQYIYNSADSKWDAVGLTQGF